MTHRELADHEVKARREDAEMIRRPTLWPHLVLPMKRGGSWDSLEFGVITEAANGEPTRIYLTGITELDFENCKTLEYESPEAACADGWRVD